MFSYYLHTALFLKSPQQMRLWLGMSLIIAALYGLWGTSPGWQSPYSINDDARQHVFWMARFLDPALFPNDLIADYFQTIAPWGYTSFYQLFARVGIDPLQLSQVLPIAIGILATAYGFQVCLQFLPIPFAGFLTAVLLNQLFWSHDDLASATPRAFMPLFFLMFLYYFMQRKRWLCLGTIVLEGLFYPQYVLVFAGILGLHLVKWQKSRFKLMPQTEIWFCLAGLITALLVLFSYTWLHSQYGPVITAAAAKQLPDFAPEGHARFFLPDPFLFWLTGNRSGVFPTLKPPLMAIGLLLPLLLLHPHHFQLAKSVTSKINILPRIIFVAFALFFAAHLLLFKLHLPSRYTAYTLRFVFIFAAALSLTLLLEAGLCWLQRSAKFSRHVFVWSVILGFSNLLLLYPLYAEQFPNTGYEQGKAIELYQYLAKQPKDSLVASLLSEADNIPIFARRSVLVAPEYAVPYHIGYATPFRKHAQALIAAQYTSDPQQLRHFIQQYGVDFWLIDRRSFDASTFQHEWIRQYPDAIAAATQNLQRGQPIVQQQSQKCTVLQGRAWRLLKADCLIQF